MLRVMGIWEHERSRSSAWGGDRIQASVTLQTWLWGGSPTTPNPNRRMHGWSIPFPFPTPGILPGKPLGEPEEPWAHQAWHHPNVGHARPVPRHSPAVAPQSRGSSVPLPSLGNRGGERRAPGGPGAPPCLAPAPVLMRKERGGGGDLLALIAGDRDSLVAMSPRKVCGGPAFVRKDLIRAAGKGQRGKAPEDVRVSVLTARPCRGERRKK